MSSSSEIKPLRSFSQSLYSRAVLVAGLATLLIPGFPAPAHGAPDDWPEYQKRIEQSRRESDQRYADWLSEREKRNQTWRETPGTPQERIMELPESGLQPGRYSLRLPFGLNVRVDVPDDSRAPKGPAAWGDRSYGDVVFRARQINTQVRELHLGWQRAGQAELAAEAARIYEQGLALANAAASRRPGPEIRSQFAAFDRLWHPFAHRCGRQPDTSASVQRRVALVTQLEEGLHRILTISPAPPYDRPLVAALTSELTQMTGRLLKELIVEPQQTLDVHALTLRAQRVAQHAADLNATVARNAPFATIVEEYEEFDRAWHRLLERVRVSPELEATVRRMSRQVRQIDLQLHQALYVNTPTINDREQLLTLSAGIAKSADHLAEDLEAETGNVKRGLVNQARVFASSGRELNSVLNDRQPAEAEEEALKGMLESWHLLKAQIDALTGDRFEHSQAVATQLDNGVRYWLELIALGYPVAGGS